MFRKILVANRGEIAVRILRACRELGIETVAVHSDVDADAFHVKLADESVCIGPAAVRESYLNIPAILSAAKITGADAVHPGYGFLAENDRFAELTGHSGIRFIGPAASAIRTMGNKKEARRHVAAAGVPVVPGMDISSETDPREVIEKVGLPLMIKAAAGGGGKGMRLVREAEDLPRALSRATSEAMASFGSGEVYAERYLEGVHHVEIQVAGDRYGNVIHLGERDCSSQRRHQKLLEEAPSPVVTPELRRAMGQAAVRAARSVDYDTVGTVEFLLLPPDEFYFLEMNTRIQVEHSVTEELTGVDLVKLQITLAAGNRLEIPSFDEIPSRHVLECRINAEDYTKGFLPRGGTIRTFHLPGGPGIRIDTHIYAGYRIPVNYDSLLMKIIAVGHDRNEAIVRMRRALEELVVEGVPTTAPFHLRFLEDETFRQGKVDTGYVERWLGSIQ
ncbi:MAG: acetyl-CoA carboxylase biotin carboxylase subunit [Candidatus Hydrogenedentota bacterium]|nr:MAG: acetyl-CoA carboxylase biotin carboxylase subunit [Candidatus Hydrogenedentota bacterium]